jgi:hypothetical protein
MALTDILSLIDMEIDRLRQAKTLLAPANTSIEPTPLPARGRPKKTAEPAPPAEPVKKKRNLSPEGRARIAEAVKRRWAAQKS